MHAPFRLRQRASLLVLSSLFLLPCSLFPQGTLTPPGAPAPTMKTPNPVQPALVANSGVQAAPAVLTSDADPQERITTVMPLPENEEDWDRLDVMFATASGKPLIWCNARTSAVEFYRKLGWEILGTEFDVPDVGPHFHMWRRVA